MAKKIIVAKFGGTSMADADAMRQAAHVSSDTGAGIIVVSATSGTTDELLNIAKCAISESWETCDKAVAKIEQRHLAIAKELRADKNISTQISGYIDQLRTMGKGISLLKECSPRTRDAFVGTGELLSSTIMQAALASAGLKDVRFLDARTIIQTDSRHEHATPRIEETGKNAQNASLRKNIETGTVYITQGFIGRSAEGSITTLGRGGSDYSAALFAEAVSADELHIWTDVAGIATTDPRIAPAAKQIPSISYEEATEMAASGAKIIYPRTLLPAHRKGIPVFVGSTFEPEKSGTWIRTDSKEAPVVRAITLKKDQGLITLTTPRMSYAYGFMAKVFDVFARHHIAVDQVTTSEVSIAISADSKTLEHAELFAELEKLGEVKVSRNLCVVGLIGNDVHLRPGLMQRIFNSLQDGGATIAIRMICQGASIHNISLMVPEEQGPDAVQRLHKHLIEEGGTE